MTKDEVREMLPRVGDKLVRRMFSVDALSLAPCTVVEVNAERFWYRVRFDSTGFCRCFKLPEIK